MTPGCGNGTLVMTLRRNQSMPRSAASLLTRGRIDAGIDRAAHQHHRARHVGILRRLHPRDRRHHRHRGLAHRDDMHVAAEEMQHRDHVVDIVVEIEPPSASGTMRASHPVGDVDIVIGQKRLDGAAQQGRIVSRHRRDDQQRAAAAAAERARTALRNARAGRTGAPTPSRSSPARARRRRASS